MRSEEREIMRETETIIDNATRCGIAYQRGYERGQHDEQANYYNDAPLSGEWAGESISELLGDLIDDAETADLIDTVCIHYENGYMAAFSDRSLCDVCNGLVTEAHAVRDNDVVYCSLSCSGDLG